MVNMDTYLANSISDDEESNDEMELPPPYTLLDDSIPDDDLVQTWQPTDMSLTTSHLGLTTAEQLVHLPKGSMYLLFEGPVQPKIHVRAEDRNSYNNLILIRAVFTYELEDAVILCDGLPIRADSRFDEKTKQLCVKFSLTQLVVDTASAIACECHVIIPESVAIEILSFKLPRNSHLTASDIPSNTLERMDVTMVSGNIELQKLSVSNLRAAVGDGIICAQDIQANCNTEFIAIQGTIDLQKCTAKHTMRINTTETNLDINHVSAYRLDIKGKAQHIEVHNAKAVELSVALDSGSVFLDDIQAENLYVRTVDATIQGTWEVKKTLDVEALSAIIQGKIKLGSDNVRVKVKTSSWPVRLAVSNVFKGPYDVRAINSVVNFGFNGTTYENHPGWRQGMVGIGSNSLDVECLNAPVVIEPMS